MTIVTGRRSSCMLNEFSCGDGFYGFGGGVHLGAGGEFGSAPEAGVGAELGVPLCEREAADDLVFEEGRVHLFGGDGRFEDELVEAGGGGEEDAGVRLFPTHPRADARG